MRNTSKRIESRDDQFDYTGFIGKYFSRESEMVFIMTWGANTCPYRYALMLINFLHSTVHDTYEELIK